MGLIERIRRFFRRPPPPAPEPGRAPRIHVVLIDGTMAEHSPEDPTSIGLIHELAAEAGAGGRVRLHYERGIPWRGWRHAADVAFGLGISGQICRAYRFLSEGWQPGDRIMLFGFSRGAYAVRALAGMIERVGLVRCECTDEEAVAASWELYCCRLPEPGEDGAASDELARARQAEERLAGRLHPPEAVAIDFLGVFDTVRALGSRLPLLGRLMPAGPRFADRRLGPLVRIARHALAIDETRLAYSPILWRTDPGETRVIQMWFPGTHGDVGGMLGDFQPARPLANIPLVWMLGEAEAAGLPLPEGWRERLPTDPLAPSVGSWRGFGKLFLLRRRRAVGRDPSERIHESVTIRRQWLRRRHAPAGEVSAALSETAAGR
ncbi:MAG: DUF2235 domain-containing protein [Alphaproteobacteria bacterium]|nr:MAG: DUF2235 domain-containing protein [Alphaproteobacteria bacterium]